MLDYANVSYNTIEVLILSDICVVWYDTPYEEPELDLIISLEIYCEFYQNFILR